HIAMYANLDEIPTKNLGTDAQKQKDYMAEVESISHQDIDGDGQIGSQDEKDD
ncbi:diacylglycerol kinase, partial [Lactobacillus gasseri]